MWRRNVCPIRFGSRGCVHKVASVMVVGVGIVEALV